MPQHKPVKIFLCFAVLLLVAKPFVGFSMFNRVHQPAKNSILVKSFTKRKQEYAENSKFDMVAIQRKLADPVGQSFLRFSFLLSLLFPLIYKISAIENFGSSLSSKFNFSHGRYAFLLNRQLII